MKSCNIVFYIDLKYLMEEKYKKNVESVTLLIEYLRIISKIHLGAFDMHHLDGYGPNGLDKISIDFRKFEDFRDFMEEKWVSKIDSIALTDKELLNYRKKQEVPE